jgi:hypothetical protein
MGVRHPSARQIKIHRTYTVEEIARVLGVRAAVGKGRDAVD